MFTGNRHFFSTLLIAAGVSATPFLSRAATIEVDGTTIKTLSEAVKAAQQADDGPHTINITTDKLPTPDGQVIIEEPMTINGDADGNGVKCDILADVETIQTLPVGRAEREKGYLEIQCAGRVSISDLQIHPNADASDVESEFVDAVRLLAPPNPSDHGDYHLTRVWASGSNANNAYVPLDTTEDLYNKPGIKRWSGQDQRLARAVIQVDKEKPQRKALNQLGKYDSTLTDCHAGLGRGPAINIAPNSGKHQVIGGVFGHCGAEGFRVAGETVTIKGTPEKRVSVLRAGSESGGAKIGAFSALFDARIDMMEHVDVAGSANAEPFLVASTARINSRENCNEVKDLAQMFGPSTPAAADGAAVASVGWLSPTDAWSQAQARKKPMLLYFYSPGVTQAEQLSAVLEAEAKAKQCLGNYCCSRVNVRDTGGDVIAKQYQVYKVPTLLLISPDAKSFKKLTPSPGESWDQIQAQLTAQ